MGYFLIFLEVAAEKEKNSAPGIDPDAEEKNVKPSNGVFLFEAISKVFKNV